VNDLFALRFQGAGAYQDFESGLGAQPGHTRGQANRLFRDCTHCAPYTSSVENRNSKTENGNWKIENRNRKTEIGKSELEIRKSKLENGNSKIQTGNWRLYATQ
jgi:hypothetical protein